MSSLVLNSDVLLNNIINGQLASWLTALDAALQELTWDCACWHMGRMSVNDDTFSTIIFKSALFDLLRTNAVAGHQGADSVKKKIQEIQVLQFE